MKHAILTKLKFKKLVTSYYSKMAVQNSLFFRFIYKVYIFNDVLNTRLRLNTNNRNKKAKLLLVGEWYDTFLYVKIQRNRKEEMCANVLKVYSILRYDGEKQDRRGKISNKTCLVVLLYTSVCNSTLCLTYFSLDMEAMWPLVFTFSLRPLPISL